jgi:hypothetical protein
VAIEDVPDGPPEPKIGEVLDHWLAQPDTVAALGPAGMALVVPHVAALRRRFGGLDLVELTVDRMLAAYARETPSDGVDLASGAERGVLGLALDVAVTTGLVSGNPLRGPVDGYTAARFAVPAV